MMARIAVIDTGIDIGNKYLPMRQFQGICIRKEGHGSDYRIVYTEDEPKCIQDNIGHGTAVSGIILSHNPELFTAV